MAWPLFTGGASFIGSHSVRDGLAEIFAAQRELNDTPAFSFQTGLARPVAAYREYSPFGTPSVAPHPL